MSNGEALQSPPNPAAPVSTVTPLQKLVNEAVDVNDEASEAPIASTDYERTPAGMLWHKMTRDGPTAVRLSNFPAWITEEVTVDDGAEIFRKFCIQTLVNGNSKTVMISASQFSAMSWVLTELGADAVISAGTTSKDRLREAIQTCSPDIRTRHVYSHSGWRQIQGKHYYLHAAGAIGPNGPVKDIAVDLPQGLSDYCLPNPPVGDELRRCIRASLGLLDVARPNVSLPLLAVIFRAVLGPPDWSFMLFGKTGSGKTELATLAQQHFGTNMHSRNLPGAWASTANSLEAMAFYAKDAVLVVDDLAPTGSRLDDQRLHKEVARVLRAAGNRAGRRRMAPDGSLRPAKAPRALILGTGEEVPRGASVLARVFIAPVAQGDVDWGRLTAAQQDGGNGTYALSMAAFVQWVARNYSQLQQEFKKQTDHFRSEVVLQAHKRQITITSELLATLDLLLDFAEQAGVFTREEANNLFEGWEKTIVAVAEGQREYQAATDPVQRFRELLVSALATGEAHLENRDGCKPPDSERWGWKDLDPQGRCVGWIEREDIYLEPDAVYSLANILAERSGEPLGAARNTLTKRMEEEGILATRDQARQRRTVRITVKGKRLDVLHIRASWLVELATLPKSWNRIANSAVPTVPANPNTQETPYTHWSQLGQVTTGDNQTVPGPVPNGTVSGRGGTVSGTT